jgi:hypothetical protein
MPERFRRCQPGFANVFRNCRTPRAAVPIAPIFGYSTPATGRPCGRVTNFGGWVTAASARRRVHGPRLRRGHGADHLAARVHRFLRAIEAFGTRGARGPRRTGRASHEYRARARPSDDRRHIGVCGNDDDHDDHDHDTTDTAPHAGTVTAAANATSAAAPTGLPRHPATGRAGHGMGLRGRHRLRHRLLLSGLRRGVPRQRTGAGGHDVQGRTRHLSRPARDRDRRSVPGGLHERGCEFVGLDGRIDRVARSVRRLLAATCSPAVPS